MSSPGSPPPVRGILIYIIVIFSFFGLTPARAGNTFSPLFISTYNQAHPRPCGEYSRSPAAPFSLLGSPPPVRGILNIFPTLQKDLRLTPARAGNTEFGSWISALPWAHPRPCGEYSNHFNLFYCFVGSPPPVRGILNVFAVDDRKPGLTPARAGNTQLFL